MIRCVGLARGRLRDDERGAGLVEYALLLVLIAMVCLAAVQLFGGSVNNNLSRSASSISGAG